MSKSIAKCLCGCGTNVHSKANYRPGHDARHAGQVGRLAVELFDSGQGHWDSKEFYGDLPSPELRDKALAVARKIVTRRAAAEARGNVRGDTNLSSLRGSRRSEDETIGTAKVGRWTYPARRLPNGTYERNGARDGSGEWFKIHESAFIPAGLS